MIGPSARALKSCCAVFYEEPILRALLGNVLHPGGLRTTTQLGRLLGIESGDRVLDIACGPGGSVVHLVDTFGCRVTGVDFSARSIAEGKTAVGASAIAGRAQFAVGDAECLPFRDGVFDVVMVECSLCLIPNKKTAAGEMRRVLRPGGRIGVADLAIEKPLPSRVDEMLAWAACVAGAHPAAGYERLLKDADFVDLRLEDASWALTAIVEEVGRNVFLLDVAAGLGKLPDLPITLAEVRDWLSEARRWIARGMARYILLTGRRQN